MNVCKVKSFVYYEHHKNDFVIEHSHNCYECVFYTGGKGIITADNDVLIYDGPTITFVSPFIKHDEKTLEFSKLFIILFECDDLKFSKPFTGLRLTEEQAALFGALYAKMQDEEKEKKAYYKNIVNAYFNIVLSEYLRATGGDNRISYEQELVGRIKNYIRENYKQDIDFEQIAASFGYSYDRFRHIFRNVADTSIHQYLMECRLYAAKQMLLSTKMPVKDIAADCGFGSNIHFNNFFKKKMNISPLQFRHSSRNRFDVGVFNIDGAKDQDD